MNGDERRSRLKDYLTDREALLVFRRMFACWKPIKSTYDATEA